MNSNSQTPVSGNVTTKKPNEKDIVSSAEPVKRVGQTGVSLARSASGVSKSKKPKDKAVISSTDLANRAGQPGEPLATAISGDSKSKKSSGKAVASSAEPVKRARQHGVSPAIAVSGDPKSKMLNGRSVVSSSAEVLFFRDVKYGPQEGELRFCLIHFWEAQNALTKVFLGLEMLMIDGQVYSDNYDFALVLIFRSNTNIPRFCFLLSTGYCDPGVHHTKHDRDLFGTFVRWFRLHA